MNEERVVGGAEQGQSLNKPFTTTEGATGESSSNNNSNDVKMAHVTSSSPPTTSALAATHNSSVAAELPSSTLPTDLPDSSSPVSLESPRPGQMQRQPTEALGPASDSPIAIPAPPAAAAASSASASASAAATGPYLGISLMLTTGARHPYRIDEKYLRSRKVEARKGFGSGAAFDPRELSGYQLKELIWTDWRGEWEPRPASPSSIRLIIMGRMIEDKAALKDFPFSLDAPNVVHMTVKPADLIDDDETAAKGTGKAGALRGRDVEDQGAGCRCVIL